MSFKCNQCDYVTNEKRNFTNHQKSHERRDKIYKEMNNPVKCEKCPTYCKNMLGLRKHLWQVHPKVLIQCDLCGKFFKTRQKIKRHCEIHIKNFSNV